MKDIFWKEWIKFVITLLIIVGVWVLIIFIADKIFHKSFVQLKYLHYFIFFSMIAKARNVFLKKINIKDDKKEER